MASFANMSVQHATTSSLAEPVFPHSPRYSHPPSPHQAFEKQEGQNTTKCLQMHLVRIIAFIHPRVRYARHGLPEKLTDWLPSVTKLVFQEPVLWNNRSNVFIMLEKTPLEGITILSALLVDAEVSQSQD